MIKKTNFYYVTIISLLALSCSDSTEMKDGSIFKQSINKDLSLTLDNGSSYKGMYSPTHKEVNVELVSIDGSIIIPIQGTFTDNEYTYKDENEFKEKEQEILKVGLKMGGYSTTSVMDKDNIQMQFKFNIPNKSNILGKTFKLSIDDSVIIPYCENPNSTLPNVNEKVQKIHWSQLMEFVEK